MKTKIWLVDKNVDNLQSYPQITQSAELLKADQVVAFPTETVYGLGANAKSDEAVKKVFEAKGRPSDNPLIVHIATEEQLKDIVAEIPVQARKLIAEFWPGPLTLIMKRKPELTIKPSDGGFRHSRGEDARSSGCPRSYSSK